MWTHPSLIVRFLHLIFSTQRLAQLNSSWAWIAVLRPEGSFTEVSIPWALAIPRIFEKKRCLGMAGCNHFQFFTQIRWDAKFLVMAWGWSKNVVWKKYLQKNIGKTVSAASKGEICCTGWRPKQRSWAEMLGAGNTKKLCMRALFFFFLENAS